MSKRKKTAVKAASFLDRKKCPECGGQWEYREGGMKLTRLVGLEDPAVYDGVSWWRCPHCLAEWCRWTEKLVSGGKHVRRKGRHSEGKVRRR